MLHLTNNLLTSSCGQFRNALNIAALAAFLTYVGAGLDGQAGMGDFNLQMNDNYQGKVVKGCPTYEQGKHRNVIATILFFYF